MINNQSSQSNNSIFLSGVVSSIKIINNKHTAISLKVDKTGEDKFFYYFDIFRFNQILNLAQGDSLCVNGHLNKHKSQGQWYVNVVAHKISQF